MNRKHPVVYALLLAVLLSLSSASFAQIAVGVSFNVRIAPPALPVYEQPLCPGPGYLWTPGYWAWDDDAGYYWVPGTWVVAPVGLLWTPGYWGWSGGFYGWHAGYWGPHIGFYGGVNYGYGYGGVGFVGGEWRGGAFFYNTAVMRVDTIHITNVYVNRTVIVNNESHVAFNGGEGGITARPRPEEERAEHEEHRAALTAQTQHEHEASHERQNFASENHGRPAIAATARPGEFKGHGVVAAKAAGGAYHAPARSPREARGPSGPAVSRNNAAPRSNLARPVTPSAKNNARENNTRENNTRANNSRENSTRANKAKANENKRAGNAPRPSNEFHPPSHTASAPRENNTRAENARPHSEARPAQPRSQPKAEPRSQPRTQPAPRQSAPRREAAPKPAPHPAAPREERKPKGR
jgi:WXXGXW repeat (2 copies)